MVIAMPVNPMRIQASVKFQALTATSHTPNTRTETEAGRLSRCPRSPRSLASRVRWAPSPSLMTLIASACA
jgi:hypothetical protein